MKPSAKIIQKVAAEEGSDPEELEPLYSAVDTDALDDIFASEQHSGMVAFAYMGYEIMVASDGTVVVD